MCAAALGDAIRKQQLKQIQLGRAAEVDTTGVNSRSGYNWGAAEVDMTGGTS